MSDETVRIGVLAASKIATLAVIDPAPHTEGVEVVAVGSRSLDKARAAADKWGVPTAYGSYEELIAAPDVDAIYIGTPASMHREWAIAAIEAGKHVLCEKPLAANADDARLIADVADAHPDIVVMEAYHWRYHPCADRIKAIVDSGVLGTISRIEGVFDNQINRIDRSDIRWDLAAGGGATMDLGCYVLQWARLVAGADPHIVSAEAIVPVHEIDGSLTAQVRWDSGITGTISSSQIAERDSRWLRVTGDRGELYVNNPLAAQDGGAEIRITVDGVTTIEAVDPTPTYDFQLAAFRDAIIHGAPFPTTMRDGVATMELIDACYRAAGLHPRPTA